MTAPLRADAPAKLNLYLHVLGRRDDGYHLLDSLIAFAAVHDVLAAEPAAGLSLEISGPFAPALTSEADNLVLRAARRLAAAGGVSPAARLTLDKRLPVAAGIGGGSADAAAALRLLSTLWDLRPTPEDIHALALSLGADVPVCLAGRAAFVGGIGDAVAPAPALAAAPLVLVNPGRPLATAAVFGGLSPGRGRPARFAEVAAEPAALAAMLAARSNDLTPAAAALVPEIVVALDALDAAAGCLLARMSGSGATCFGLFATEDEATGAARALQRDHPPWWVVASRLIDAI